MAKAEKDSRQLEGKKVAILATDGVEQSELLEPREALLKAGADVQVVSPKGQSIRAWKGGDWARTVETDAALESVDADDFDALVLPGGVINPDRLRMMDEAVEFVREFVDAGKPIASICHGPWMLAEADAVRGRKLTSYRSIKTDMVNAGAEWVDREVVVDEGLVTSRQPDDLPAFNRKMIEEFAEGRHERTAPKKSGQKPAKAATKKPTKKPEREMHR